MTTHDTMRVLAREIGAMRTDRRCSAWDCRTHDDHGTLALTVFDDFMAEGADDAIGGLPGGDSEPQLARMLRDHGLEPDVLGGAVRLDSLGMAVLLDADTGRLTWDASCEDAHTACELEILSEAGPGTVALEGRRLVHVPDLAERLGEGARWPRWRQVALQLRWASVVAAPARVQGVEGALILYSRTPGAFAAPALLERLAALGDAGPAGGAGEGG